MAVGMAVMVGTTETVVAGAITAGVREIFMIAPISGEMAVVRAGIVAEIAAIGIVVVITVPGAIRAISMIAAIPATKVAAQAGRVILAKVAATPVAAVAVVFKGVGVVDGRVAKAVVAMVAKVAIMAAVAVVTNIPQTRIWR